MEWFVLRRCQDGKVLGNPHLMLGAQVRARLVIEQARDATRRRTVTIARLILKPGAAEVPPLYEPSIVASDGSMMSLAGYERIEEAVTGSERWHGQAWLLTPAADEDLRKAEAEWSRLAALCAAHGLDPKAHAPEPLAPPGQRRTRR